MDDLGQKASRVTIIRDKWGVPHIYGKTDADVVFGLMYAQCEESFERVERNYLQVLGRMSEVEGEAYLYQDLQMRMLYDTAAALADYRTAPPWLKNLLQAFSDGITFYLQNHPDVQHTINRFEPWFPLLFTDGAYIATQTAGITSEDIKAFYENTSTGNRKKIEQPICLTGSNAFAIGPGRSATGNALLYINPHVSFYFRTEAHLISEEGLNAYGAITWGQFFVFQGFNEHCGWMHTSSAADVADLYAEKITSRNSGFVYEYEGTQKPVVQKTQVIAYRSGSGLEKKTYPVYYTHHGPVVTSAGGKWLTLREENRSINSLIQSWQRMKSNNLADFKKTLELRANGSTNTMYADGEGNIAYWHGNFLPKRSAAYNWSQPVDGSTSATEWKGLHELSETVHLENPTQGFLQNCNSSPFSAAGFNSVDKLKFPVYMAPEADNFRSLRAVTQIEKENLFTLEKLIALGYDHYLPVFDTLLPALFESYGSLAAGNALRSDLAEPIQLLQQWNKRSSAESVITPSAIFWAAQLISAVHNLESGNQIALVRAAVSQTTPAQKLQILQQVMAGLKRMYGSWKVPWGEINRYQRIAGSFDDDIASLPVGMASAFFGSLASYETVWSNGKRQYGVAGNSFVAAVEFIKNGSGKKVRAKSVVTGGQSFNPASKHYADQAAMFINGQFKDVLFYRDDVQRDAEITYHPGERKNSRY